MTPERMKEVINQTYENYLSGSVIEQARKDSDHKRTQFLLRLQDFATVVEANRAMSDGDIGRLMMMWKRWSVMIQGMDCITHYSNHLPRMILLLEQTLPKPISAVLKSSLLIAPRGRPKHFVAKDFFLEVMNYWIKFFYNNSVRYSRTPQIHNYASEKLTFLQGIGTDIKRLKNIYSINVQFVCHFHYIPTCVMIIR